MEGEKAAHRVEEDTYALHISNKRLIFGTYAELLKSIVK